MKYNYWRIDVTFKGIAKKQRNVKSHRFDIAELPDDLSDKRPDLNQFIDCVETTARERMRTVEKCCISAMPCSSDGSMVEFRLFDPRAFSLTHDVVMS